MKESGSIPKCFIRPLCNRGMRRPRLTKCGRRPGKKTQWQACYTASQRLSIEARTMAWARILVVGLHLCPFAEAVLDANTVRIKVSDVNNENAFSQVIHDEAQLLSKSRECDISTSLIVMPDFLPANFVRFHAACEAMEMAAEQWEDGLCDEVMIVWFHPRFCWADADGMDDVMNFDKKAPYPIVNLLRREVVDGVVRDGLAEGILGRNEERLRMMGVDKLKEAYDMLGTDGVHSL